ncbi:MAG TPA: hypothetical protein VEU32_04775 [Burkholderiales bacterium]|nr:hypothetical protein [Burkholderiales bacterium]
MNTPLHADSAAIQAVKERLAKAESERETWLASKMQEKHLEACSRVDALTLELELLERSEKLMAEYGIVFNGRHYQRDRHRYHRLADAVSFARLQRQPQAEPPSAAERTQMGEYGITFQEGAYCLGDYRYDRLCDALDYASPTLAR